MILGSSHNEFLKLQNWFISTGFSSHFLKFISWINYYFCFFKTAGFVFGLMFSHKLVYFAVLSILITYFSDYSIKEYSIKKSAVLRNVQNGLSTTLAIVATWNSYKSPRRPLKIILCSTCCYTAALWLLYYTSHESDHLREYKYDLLNITGMILLAIGVAGVKPLLGPFLARELRARTEMEMNDVQYKDKIIIARKTVWMGLAWCCSVVVAYLLHDDSWPTTFMWTGVAMGSSLFLFSLGFRSFADREKISIGSPFIIFRVVKASLRKRHLNYPSSADQFFGNDDGNQLHMSSRVKFLRWLDKAAIIESSSALDPQQQKGAGRLCTMTQVTEAKLLLKMFPMWSSFLVFGLILEAGDALFPEQGNKLDSNQFMTFFILFKHIFGETISYLTNLVILKWIPKRKRRQAQIIRIWIGMVISIFCCTVAWRVEVHRLIIVNNEQLLDKPDEDIPMNAFWLAPQFCLLGLMEGLAVNGLDEYISDHFPEWMNEHVSTINEFVIGIGSYLHIMFVYANKSVFASTLNRSRLDKYYMRLNILGFVNMCYNWYLTTRYIRSEDGEGADKMWTTNAEAI